VDVDGVGDTLLEALWDEYGSSDGCYGYIARYVRKEYEYTLEQCRGRDGEVYEERMFKCNRKGHCTVALGCGDGDEEGVLVHKEEIDEEDCCEQFASDLVQYSLENGWLFDHLSKEDNDEIARGIMGLENCPPLEAFYSEVYGAWIEMADVVGKCGGCGERLVKSDFSEHGGIGQCGRCGMPCPEGAFMRQEDGSFVNEGVKEGD